MKKSLIQTIEVPTEDIKKVSETIIDNVQSRSSNHAKTLFLEGQLGAGKTTLTKYIGEQLGVSKRLTSPTYTVMNGYPANHENFKRIIHMDLYRIETLWELQEYQLEDAKRDPKTLFIIEWSKDAKDFFKDTECFQIEIDITSETSREYKIFHLTQD